jgi:hypothetical protein
MLVPAAEPQTDADPWAIRRGPVAVIRRVLRPMVYFWRSLGKQMRSG